MKRKLDFLFWLGLGYLVLLAVFAVLGPTMRHHFLDPAGGPFEPPSGRFWLGTDEQGRDIFARLAFGARTSLLVGTSVQVVALLVGILVGVLGVYSSRWISGPLLRLTDAMFAFPDILLAILIIGLWQRGVVPMVVALSITAWPAVARLTFTQVSALNEREFVVASRALGMNLPRLIRGHVLPHLWGILLAVSMIDVAGTILAESALSFLGIGVEAPYPSWGNMIQTARAHMNGHPMLLLWPCLLLSVTIYALNFVGDGFRALTDPKE